MYDYTDTATGAQLAQSIPSDNMSINGVPLNQLVEGYRHLTVTGRGLLGQSVKTTSVPGRRGVWVEDVSDDERVLEIKYQLEARTSADMRDKFAKLNRILRTLASSGYLEITFKDEPTYTYYGYFSGADDIEEKSLSIVSKFSLIVPDGYKEKCPEFHWAYFFIGCIGSFA